MSDLRELKRLRRRVEFSLAVSIFIMLVAAVPVVFFLSASTAVYSLYALLHSNKMIHLLEKKYK